MNPLSMWSRLRGKSLRYIAARGTTELRRAVHAPVQRRRLARLTAADVLERLGAESASQLIATWAASGPFAAMRRIDDIRQWYAGHPAERVALQRRAACALSREVDLLGFGPFALGTDVKWRSDYRTGHEWPLTPSHRLDYALLHLPCDVKMAWDLSRLQHLFPLGQAWLLDHDSALPLEFRAQIESWDAANPVGLGPNWACTMDVALRAWSLLWLAAAFADAPELGEPFWGRVVRMLWQHAQWMPEHLEKGEINGNHYISDALGLVACGAFFRDAGRRCLDLGASILEGEIILQIEPDGVDIEASVPYQRLVMEIFLAGRQLMTSAGRGVSPAYDARLRACATFVATYITPEGLIPVVGDADDGRVMKFGAQDVRDQRYLVEICAGLLGTPRLPEMQESEEALWFLSGEEQQRASSAAAFQPAERTLFADGGVVVLRSDTQYCFIDVGPVGLRGLGGHGHNDILSFEWHAFGRPVLTDSGSYVYTASPEWRNRFRATDAHTAIRVDGEEANRFYGPLSLWNLHDDARPIDVRATDTATGFGAEAAHTGYERLPDPVRVARRWEMLREAATMEIRDTVSAAGEHLVEWFWQVAPGWTGTVCDGRLTLAAPDAPFGVSITPHRSAGAWTSDEGWFSPSYGVRQSRERWRYAFRITGTTEQAWTIAASAAIHS